MLHTNFLNFINETADTQARIEGLEKKIASSNDITKLRELEVKIYHSYITAKDVYGWMDSKTRTNFERKWNDLMTKARGWDVIQRSDKNTNKNWVDFCNKEALSYDYNFADILA